MNYRIVLRAGLPGEPLLGRPPVPGLSVKFNGGEALVNDDTVNKLLFANEAYNMDYFCADNMVKDPFINARAKIEPAHVLTEFKYGHVDSVKASQVPATLPPAIRKMIDEEIERGTRARLAEILERAESDRDKKEFILGKELDRTPPPPKTEIMEKPPAVAEPIQPGGIEGMVIAPELPPRPVAPQWSPEDNQPSEMMEDFGDMDTEGFETPTTGPAVNPPKRKGRPPKVQ
jgi:hypothetical protein